MICEIFQSVSFVDVGIAFFPETLMGNLSTCDAPAVRRGRYDFRKYLSAVVKEMIFGGGLHFGLACAYKIMEYEFGGIRK